MPDPQPPLAPARWVLRGVDLATPVERGTTLGWLHMLVGMAALAAAATFGFWRFVRP